MLADIQQLVGLAGSYCGYAIRWGSFSRPFAVLTSGFDTLRSLCYGPYADNASVVSNAAMVSLANHVFGTLWYASTCSNNAKSLEDPKLLKQLRKRECLIVDVKLSLLLLLRCLCSSGGSATEATWALISGLDWRRLCQVHLAQACALVNFSKRLKEKAVIPLGEELKPDTILLKAAAEVAQEVDIQEGVFLLSRRLVHPHQGLLVHHSGTHRGM